MADSSWADVFNAVFAGAAAAFAGWQIFLSRRDSNSRAAIDLLRNVDLVLSEAWETSLTKARESVLDHYRTPTVPINPQVKTYLRLLNALDLVALAVERKLVSKEIVFDHLRTLVKSEVVPLNFLDAFRTQCDDKHVYEHLERLLKAMAAEQHDRKKNDKLGG